MKTPHLWFTPSNFPSRLLGSYDHENSPDYLSLMQATPIEETHPTPLFKFTAPQRRLAKFDVLPNSIMVPLISSKVASLLAQICPHDIQLIPARIKTSDVSIDDHFLLNVVTAISGIDHARSSVEVIRGTKHMVKVNCLRYFPRAVRDHHLARESEYCTFLWASDEVVRRFAREKIKGCAFEPPEAIHP
jgi:hypothetical protein